jgi:hypothetical protein
LAGTGLFENTHDKILLNILRNNPRMVVPVIVRQGEVREPCAFSRANGVKYLRVPKYMGARVGIRTEA